MDGRFLITASISLGVIDLFKSLIWSWYNYDWCYTSGRVPFFQIFHFNEIQIFKVCLFYIFVNSLSICWFTFPFIYYFIYCILLFCLLITLIKNSSILLNSWRTSSLFYFYFAFFSDSIYWLHPWVWLFSWCLLL